MEDDTFLTGIRLTEHEKEIVQKENERLGLRNFSATLRLIIRQWDEANKNAQQEAPHAKNV